MRIGKFSFCVVMSVLKVVNNPSGAKVSITPGKRSAAWGMERSLIHLTACLGEAEMLAEQANTCFASRLVPLRGTKLGLCML